MTECEMIQDRMADVIHGRVPWRNAELGHLADCAECAAEWRIVEAGAALHQDLVVNSAAIAAGLRERIRTTPAPSTRVLPFRRAGWGLLAAAASVALVFGLRSTGPGLPVPAATTIAAALLPELEQLSESQLEAVLLDVDQQEDGVTPMRIPRLGDLSETQLEQMLKELEG